MPLRISSSDGSGLRARRSLTDMIIPGVQNPHWRPCSLQNPSCTGSRARRSMPGPRSWSPRLHRPGPPASCTTSLTVHRQAPCKPHTDLCHSRYACPSGPARRASNAPEGDAVRLQPHALFHSPIRIPMFSYAAHLPWKPRFSLATLSPCVQTPANTIHELLDHHFGCRRGQARADPRKRSHGLHLSVERQSRD